MFHKFYFLVFEKFSQTGLKSIYIFPSDYISLMDWILWCHCSYMESKKDHWAPSPMVIVKDLEGLNQLRVAVWMSHTINHQNMGERWTRRCLLVDEIVKILREVDIEYRMIPLDINVRSMPMPSPVTSSRLPPSWTASGGNWSKAYTFRFDSGPWEASSAMAAMPKRQPPLLEMGFMEKRDEMTGKLQAASSAIQSCSQENGERVMFHFFTLHSCLFSLHQ